MEFILVHFKTMHQLFWILIHHYSFLVRSLLHCYYILLQDLHSACWENQHWWTETEMCYFLVWPNVCISCTCWNEIWTISYNCYFLFSVVFLSLLLLFLCSTLICLMIYKQVSEHSVWDSEPWIEADPHSEHADVSSQTFIWTFVKIFESLCGIIHWCPLSSLYPLQSIHTSRWVESISSLQRVIFLSVGDLFEETVAFSSPSRTRASCGMEKRTLK